MCNPGYTFEGNSTRFCTADGQWTPPFNQYVKIFCPNLMEISNGHITYSSGSNGDHPINSTAMFNCNSGYILYGVSNKTCQINGSWSELSLFPSCKVEIDSLRNNTPTEENYVMIVSGLSSLSKNTLDNTDLQSSETLGSVSQVFSNIAMFVDSSNATINSSIVENLASTLDSLLQWTPGALETGSSLEILQSFETVVSYVSQQENVTEEFDFSTFSVAILNDKVSNFQKNAVRKDFFENRNSTGSISLPKEAFNQVPNEKSSIGVSFAFYENSNLFPTPENNIEGENISRIVGSPIIAATIGQNINITGLASHVIITLELKSNVMHVEKSERCVSWNFTSNQWVTDGCKTVRNDSNTVTCLCTHLTNFAVLIDVCSRTQDCQNNPTTKKILEITSIIGVVLSCTGLALTIITLLAFKKLRARDSTAHHIQLCIAIFCMLVVFVAGIDKTELYAGCVAVSVLIHYFSLAAVMWMGAEAVLMFRKLVIIFGEITNSYVLIVSFVCWVIPLIPVLATLITDQLSNDDLIIKRNAENATQSPGFCFLNGIPVFFGAFLGPVFAVIIMNFIIFVWITVIVLRSTKAKLKRANKKISLKKVVRLMTSLIGVMLTFGITWVSAALTIQFGHNISVFRDIFQALFVIFGAFQGFFIFIFFCVLDKRARNAWKYLFFNKPKSNYTGSTPATTLQQQNNYSSDTPTADKKVHLSYVPELKEKIKEKVDYADVTTFCKEKEDSIDLESTEEYAQKESKSEQPGLIKFDEKKDYQYYL